MRAVVLDAPGPPEALRIRELPVPEPRPGWVLIRVGTSSVGMAAAILAKDRGLTVLFPTPCAPPPSTASCASPAC